MLIFEYRNSTFSVYSNQVMCFFNSQICWWGFFEGFIVFLIFIFYLRDWKKYICEQYSKLHRLCKENLKSPPPSIFWFCFKIIPSETDIINSWKSINFEKDFFTFYDQGGAVHLRISSSRLN